MPRKKEPTRAQRTVEVVDSNCQPSKAELEADVSIDATPDDVARALTQTVNVRRVKPSKKAASGHRDKAASARSDKPRKK
jgi:hypothetical protein